MMFHVATLVVSLVFSPLATQEVSGAQVLTEVGHGGTTVLTLVQPTVSVGTSAPIVATSMSVPASGVGGKPQESAQTLTTTVQDPTSPDEPWIVVTYRKPGESPQSFIKRHRDMVSAVRDALNG